MLTVLVGCQEVRIRTLVVNYCSNASCDSSFFYFLFCGCGEWNRDMILFEVEVFHFSLMVEL